METNLVIHVRSPSLNETLIVSTNLSATVLSLKESIEPIHPHHPTVENQRIIYSGKLLQDTDLLCNIVKNVKKKKKTAYSSYIHNLVLTYLLP